MTNPVVGVFATDDSIQDTGELENILKDPIFQGKKIAVIATVCEHGESPWKTFILNSLLKFLECDGVVNWFGWSWENRNRSHFHARNKNELIPHGIYFWPHPFITENSRGESIAILLADVVQNGSKSPLAAIATMISTTFISISEASFQSGTLDLLQHLDQVDDQHMKQFVAVIFDFPPSSSSFGSSQGMKHLHEQIEAQNGVKTFLNKIQHKECWLLPEQELFKSLKPNKDFVKHFKKLFSSSILDSDTIPVFPSSNDLIQRLSSSIKIFHNSIIKMKPSIAERSYMEVPMNSSRKHKSLYLPPEDIEMLDLSDDSGVQHQTQSVQPYSTQELNTENESPTENLSLPVLTRTTSNPHPHVSTLTLPAKLPCSGQPLVSGNDPEGNDLNSNTRQKVAIHNSMCNEERDEIVGDLVRNTMEEYSKWLSAYPGSFENIQKENEEEVTLLLERFRSFCEENGLDAIADKYNTLQRTLGIEFNKTAKKRGTAQTKRNENGTEGQKTGLRAAHEIQKQSYLDHFNMQSPTPSSKTNEPNREEAPLVSMAPKYEFDTLLYQHLDEIRSNYGKLSETILQNLESKAGELEHLNIEFRSKVNLKTNQLCEKFAIDFNAVQEASNIVLDQLFYESSIIFEGILSQKQELLAKIRESSHEYSKLMEAELRQIFQGQIQSIAKKFPLVHNKILEKVTPKFFKYQNFIDKTMRDEISSRREPFEQVVKSILEYFQQMKKIFDSYISLSPEKFIELSSRTQDRITTKFEYKNLDSLLKAGLSAASEFAEAKNAEILQAELQQSLYSLTLVKNLYNQEMKFRLESTTGMRSDDLQKMHQELVTDCVGAMKDTCHFHKDSGIPDQEYQLRSELDKGFATFSNSNQLKLDKSIRVINSAIRKYKNQYLEELEEKLKAVVSGVSEREFQTLNMGIFSHVAKLLEIDLRNIPGNENVEIHKTALRKLVEAESIEFREENNRKWNEKIQLEKAEQQQREQELEAERRARRKEDAALKKREQEEKARKDALEIQRKKEERQLKDKHFEREKLNTKTDVESKVHKDSCTDFDKYKTSNSEYGAACGHSAPKSNQGMAPPPPSVAATGRGEKKDKFTIAIEFGLTHLRVGIIVDEKFVSIPNERGQIKIQNEIWFTGDNIWISEKGPTCKEGFSMMEVMLNSNWKGDTFSWKGRKVEIKRKEFIYALILAKVKKCSEMHLQRNISGLVITVPLWYNSKQRQEIKDAALIADFEDVTLLNETTAVVLACAMEEARVNSANDMLVVVENQFCDAAVYSYSKNEIKMLSNSGDFQLPPRPGKSFVQHTITGLKNLVVRAVWNHRGDNDRDEVIKGVMKLAVKDCKNIRQIMEVAVVGAAQYCATNLHAMRHYGRIIKCPPLQIITGAALLAEKLTNGSKMSVKELSTNQFMCNVSKGKAKTIFPAHCPTATPQLLGFGNCDDITIGIYEGGTYIGQFKIKVMTTYENQDVDLNVNFELEADGIFSEKIKVDAKTLKGKEMLGFFIESYFNYLELDCIQEMKSQVYKIISENM